MAQLPPDGQWLMQHIGDEVILFHRETEDELVRFNPHDGASAARAQGLIAGLGNLTREQRSFAHFWSGYFYAHATGVFTQED